MRRHPPARKALQDRTNTIQNDATITNQKAHKGKDVISRHPHALQDDSTRPARRSQRSRPSDTVTATQDDLRKSTSLQEQAVLRKAQAIDVVSSSISTRGSGIPASRRGSSAKGQGSHVRGNTHMSAQQEEQEEMDALEDHLLDDSVNSTSQDLSENNMFSFTGSVLQATPLAAQISSHALSRFKRRPRQPSMLVMVQRLAGARSSVNGSMTDATPERSDFEADDIEDDFLPDLAGTPAHINRTSSNTTKSSTRGLSKRSAVAEDLNTSTTEMQSSDDKSCFTRSRHALRSSSAGIHSDYVTAVDADQQEHVSISSAEPASSPETSLEGLPVISQQVAASPEDSSLFADPTSQSTPSPDRGRGKRRKLNKVPSTADLQSMLPRRRRVIPGNTTLLRDELDYSSDSEPPTIDDESFHLGSVARSALRRADRSRVPGSTVRRALSRAQSRHATYSRLVEPSPGPAQCKTRKRGHNARSTNRRRPVDADAVDVEQEEEEAEEEEDSAVAGDTTTSVYVTSITDDLEAAKRKFAEIDQWEMDFENVTPEDLTTSSQDYR